MSVCVYVFASGGISIRERGRDHKIPFIVFLFVLKCQDLFVSLLYCIYFIKLEKTIIVSCQPQYPQYTTKHKMDLTVEWIPNVVQNQMLLL